MRLPRGAQQELGNVAIDMLAQPRVGRRRRLLVADMEATIIANEMLDELAELRGLRAQIAGHHRGAP